MTTLSFGPEKIQFQVMKKISESSAKSIQNAKGFNPKEHGFLDFQVTPEKTTWSCKYAR